MTPDGRQGIAGPIFLQAPKINLEHVLNRSIEIGIFRKEPAYVRQPTTTSIKGKAKGDRTWKCFTIE